MKLTAEHWKLLDRIGRGQLVLTPTNTLMWQDAGNLTDVVGWEKTGLRQLWRDRCIDIDIPASATPYENRNGLVTVEVATHLTSHMWEYLIFGPDESTS